MMPERPKKLMITPPQAEVIVNESQSFKGHGGTPPYSFTLASNGSGGDVEGDTGAYTAGLNPGVDIVRVTDAAGKSDDAEIRVTEPLQLASPDDAVMIGTATTFQATGGTPPYTFAFADAGNVSGGSLHPNNGEYTAGATPSTDTIRVTDDSGRTATRTVDVKPALQIEVPADSLDKVQLGSPQQDPAWWETWESWGDTPPNPSSALEITVATGVEVVLEVVGGVPDFSVGGTLNGPGNSNGTVASPPSGARTFTYKAGLQVGANRRSTDTLTITDGQSTPNQATVKITVTEKFEDLAALASAGSFQLPFVAYRTWHPFIGFSFHDGLLPSPTGAVPANKLPCFGGGLLHQIGLQSLPSRGHAGKRGPVTAPGRAYLMGRGSDVGFVVLHISIPPTNYLLPLVILLGESKSLFGSSSVKLPCWSLMGGEEECDTACAFPIPWLPVVGLNLGCSDNFPLPTDFVVAPSTILVGMGWKDLLAAALDIALEYAVAGIMKGVGAGSGQVSEKLAKSAKTAGKEVAEKAVKEAVQKAAKEVSEQAAEQAAAKAAKKAAKAAAKEAAQKAAKEAAKETAAKAAKEAAGEAAEKAAKEAAAKAAEEAAAKAAKEAANEAAEKAAKEAADQAAKEAAAKAANDAAKEAAAKAAKDAANETAEKATKEAADKAAEEAAAKAAKETANEAAEKATKEAADKAAEEAAAKTAKETANEAADKASREAGEQAGKAAAAKKAKQAAETKRLGMKSLDPGKMAKKGFTPDKAYDELVSLPAGKKSWGVVKGVIEDVVVKPLVQYPLGLGKAGFEHLIGLEEFDSDNWWDFSPFAPPIVRAITGDRQRPAGEGWWFD